MEWAPSNSRWRSCWNWTPPEGWPPGNTCKLRYQVSDGRGGSSAGLMAGDYTSAPTSRLVYAQVTPRGEYEIVTSAPDGKNATFASVEGDTYSHFFPSFSPNGQLIVSLGWDYQSLPQRAIFLSKADGSQATKIFQSANQLGFDRPSCRLGLFRASLHHRQLQGHRERHLSNAALRHPGGDLAR